MKNEMLLNSSGILQRKDNSLFFETEESKTPIPIENVSSFFAFGPLEVGSRTLELLSKYRVPIHYFGYYGNYVGSFLPREQLLSGFVLVRQVEHYLEEGKRLELAREFISGALSNLAKNIDSNFKITEFARAVKKAEDIPSLMGIEGRARDYYYTCLDEELTEEFRIGIRVRRPPGNMGNALISFGNGMCYAAVLNEIYRTQLNPTISYLHEPGERRFSLALDIAEVFKPFLVDRLILRLVNLKMLQEKHFNSDFEGTFLEEKGRKIFLEEWDKRLKTTVYHRQLSRQVSYQTLIRLECMKLIKHLTGEKRYKAFKMWW